jgi:hypothetical protein
MLPYVNGQAARACTTGEDRCSACSGEKRLSGAAGIRVLLRAGPATYSLSRTRNRTAGFVDQNKIGTPWSDDELDAIIADYFAMLDAELTGRPYVKSHHSSALMERIGRTHRSVEFKHQNISAVLEELGLPWIRGYAEAQLSGSDFSRYRPVSHRS